MVRHDHTKPGGHKHCDSEDKLFLVVQEQDFTWSLKSLLISVMLISPILAIHVPGNKYWEIRKDKKKLTKTDKISWLQS